MEKEKFIQAVTEAKPTELSLEIRKGGAGNRYFNMALTPVFDQQKLDLFIGIVSEVTLLKRRESQFFNKQKLESLGLLAAGVAHDFNNILSIITGYSWMAAKATEDGRKKEMREQALLHLSKIDAAADRGSGLTRKMLTFSKHKIVEKNVIDLCNVISEQKDYPRDFSLAYRLVASTQCLCVLLVSSSYCFEFTLIDQLLGQLCTEKSMLCLVIAMIKWLITGLVYANVFGV